MKRMMLYFGSFNPVHKGHTALAEYVLERGLCDEVALVVSPRSPYKETAELAPELDRFEMAEIACAASEYPDRIKPSAVEFLLPKPSYTIDTLRYLTQNFGSEMRFSILMGGDQIARLDGWKEYERVLEYPIYVYPRRGERTNRFAGRITVLDDAPLQDLSATQIRERIGRGEAVDGLLDDGVAEYIRRKGLWSPASRIAALSVRIDAGTADAALYVERGRLHFRLNEWALPSTTSTGRWPSTRTTPRPGSTSRWRGRFWSSATRTSTTPETPQADSETIETTQTTRTTMEKLKIALLAGGDSPEREIALQSAAQIAAALDRGKYDVTVIDLHRRDWHYTAPDGRQWQVDKNDFSLTVEGERREFDYALVIIHGTPGEDGRLQGYLDMMGIPYSSCSMVSSVITFDKITTKRTLAGRGINLAREVFLRRDEAFDAARIVADLGLPLFVKPNANGSSFGVTKVHTPEELPAAIATAFAQGDEILVEECIAGREMGCGVMIAGGKEYLFPITEIIPRKEFFDYEAKYTAGRSEEITPADIAPEVKAELNRMTLEAYRTCRCSGVVRVDFIVTPEGRPYFIELNSIPGMSAGSIVPKQVRAMGMTLGELFDIVIDDTRRK